MPRAWDLHLNYAERELMDCDLDESKLKFHYMNELCETTYELAMQTSIYKKKLETKILIFEKMFFSLLDFTLFIVKTGRQEEF